MSIKIDDLEINSFKIYQDKSEFAFSMDSVLLSNFIIREEKLDKSSSKNYNIIDLCSGNIPIPLIIYAKSKKDIKIDCIEVNKKQTELSKKSLEYNKQFKKSIEKDIKVVNDDIKNIYLNKNRYKEAYNTYDIVSCNPPYKRDGAYLKSMNQNKNIAKNEVDISFFEICKISNLLLKSNKNFYIVNRTERLTEIFESLRQNKIEPKKIQFIHSYVDKPSKLFLLKSVKGGKMGLTVLNPIIIYKEKFKYTDEVLSIYGK